MTDSTTRRLATFAIACGSLLLAGTLAAQADSGLSRTAADEQDKKQAYYDKVAHHQDKPTVQIEPGPDALPTDRSAGIDPVPEPIPAAEPMDLRLSIRSVDGGLAVTMQQRTDGPTEQLWIGGILGALDAHTVPYGAGLPPLLGRSTVLAAAVVTPGQLDPSITAEVRPRGFHVAGFYVQGVAVTLDGAQATRVLSAEFGEEVPAR